jgi:hypothetical protein
MNQDNPYGIQLIDHVLVQVPDPDAKKGNYAQSQGGLFIPESASNDSKVPSYGTLQATPTIVTHENQRRVGDALMLLTTGKDVVHFSTRRSYDYLPAAPDGYKLLFIPLDAITALAPV